MVKKAVPRAELNVVLIADRDDGRRLERTLRRLEIGKRLVRIEDDPARQLLLVWNSGPTDVEIVNDEGERLSTLKSAGGDFVYYPSQRCPISARVVA